MDKDTAITLFMTFERQTFEFANHEATGEAWYDENTPPTERLPTFDVRLDAQITNEHERDYRLRVVIGQLPPRVEALAEIARLAGDADVTVAVQNHGIELA